MIDADPSLGIHHEDQCLARCTTFCDDGEESEVVEVVHEMCCGRGENKKQRRGKKEDRSGLPQ